MTWLNFNLVTLDPAMNCTKIAWIDRIGFGNFLIMIYQIRVTVYKKASLKPKITFYDIYIYL